MYILYETFWNFFNAATRYEYAGYAKKSLQRIWKRMLIIYVIKKYVIRPSLALIV